LQRLFYQLGIIKAVEEWCDVEVLAGRKDILFLVVNYGDKKELDR